MELTPEGFDKPANVNQSLLPEQPAVSNLAFNAPQVNGSIESPFHATGTTDIQPENQPFQPTIPPHTILPDTDDLLDALTDRILRDFRRYYP